MREIGIRELFWGKAKKNRAFFCSIWFRDHNNPRMSALLPRLGFLDAFLMRMPRAACRQSVDEVKDF
jgi:hypothetical protein